MSNTDAITTGDSQEKSRQFNIFTQQEKDALRQKIVQLAKTQLGKPYVWGAEAKLDDPDPKAFDCSEFVRWIFFRSGLKIPDGSFNQFEYCKSIEKGKERIGDLGFFRNQKGIYHVGILFDNESVIESRTKQTDGIGGKVIFRPKVKWDNFKNFAGWKSHPLLI